MPAPQRRPAGGAELLRVAAARRLPSAHQFLAGEDAQRAGHDPRLRRRSRARAPLAALAVAVAAGHERLRDLEAHAAAHAAAGEGEVRHTGSRTLADWKSGPARGRIA